MDTKVNIFSQIPTVDLDRNLFERNHQWKGTLDGGFLYPVFCDEVLPGDTKKLNTTFFGRMSTPIVPIMDNIYLDYHLWFVPRRLVWEHWDEFLGARENPNDSIDYLIPQVQSGTNGGYPRYSYFDYFGIRPGVNNLSVDACYFRSLIKIWNDWYRDNNLQVSIPLELGDGPDALSNYTNFNYGSDGTLDTDNPYLLLPRGKRHDYFTTCLPTPQKGDPVDIPLTGNIPVVGTGQSLGITRVANGESLGDEGHLIKWRTPDSVGGGLQYLTTSGIISPSANTSFNIGVRTEPDKSGLIALLSDASAVTINAFRNAVALQQFLETDNIYGDRVVSLVLGHFGVRIPDYRLQRAEYLGGGTSRININPVAQTSSTDTISPQGNLSAYATVASTGNGFAQSFTEHGVIIGLVSIRTDLNYQQGIPRMFSRKTRYDFFWPMLAHLGNMPVYNKEIYAQGTSADDGIFGYQEKDADYRYKENIITGKFRSDDPQSLDVWHLAQDFSSLPQLNAEFIVEKPPFDRVIAVQDEPQFLLDAYHEYDDIRVVPLYGTPGLRRL